MRILLDILYRLLYTFGDAVAILLGFILSFMPEFFINWVEHNPYGYMLFHATSEIITIALLVFGFANFEWYYVVMAFLFSWLLSQRIMP